MSESSPFEIEMSGLGHFMMRREVWPGFHPLHRSFGGEEGYIHEKVRRLGGKALCHPLMGWRHRFRDETEPVPYPASLEDHTWNLLVEHRELGIEAEQPLYDHFGKRFGDDKKWAKLVTESRLAQPFGVPVEPPHRLRILGVWYSNNLAPDKLLQDSLNCVRAAVVATNNHDVEAQSSSWEPIPDNPLPWTVAPDRNAGHANIIQQVQQSIEQAREYPWDVICFLEHDVLYPADYFDRVGDAFMAMQGAQVVSNLDYEGLNGTGWLKVKERHEPLHQLSMRRDYALANLERAAADCAREGWAYLEPQGGRQDWARLEPTGKSPSIHVNHPGRFTSHGEVCYEQRSSAGDIHFLWGSARKWWPLPPELTAHTEFPCIHRGAVLRTDACNLCGQKGQTFEILECTVHGNCSVGRKHSAIRSCVACEDRQEPAAKPAKPVPSHQFLRDRRGERASGWFDVYHGAHAFLICGGPSLEQTPLHLLRIPGLLTAAVNNVAVLFRPDLWFSVDVPGHFTEAIWRDPGIAKFVMWKHNSERLRRWNPDAKQHELIETRARDIPNTWFYEHDKGFDPTQFLIQPRPTWGWGGVKGEAGGISCDVMLPAIRILHWMGIRTLYLVGTDFQMNAERPYVFDETSSQDRVDWNNRKFKLLNEMLEQMQGHFAEHGYRIFNCTPGGNLTAFPRMELPNAIEAALAQAQFPQEVVTRGMYVQN